MAIKSLRLIYVFSFLLILGLLVYCNSFSNKFLIDDYSFLDTPIKSSMKFISMQWNPYRNALSGIETSRAISPYYRPLAHIIPTLCFAIFGSSFWLYHLFNLLLYVVATFLIFILILRISNSQFLALLSSAFYILHPINGIIVNYSTASVFAAQVIFITGAILLLWESIRSHNRLLYFLSLISFVLSLFCHETSVVTPLYIGSVLFVTGVLRGQKRLLCLVPYFLILFSYLLFRVCFVGFGAPFSKIFLMYQMNIFEYIASMFISFSWYISQLFYPHGIVMIWGMPVMRLGVFWANVGMLALCILFVYLFLVSKGNQMVQIALTWICIGFLPVFLAAGHSPFDGICMEPHWLVFPVLGFFILFAQLVLSVYSRINKYLSFLILLGVMVYWIQASWAYNHLWSDQKTYMTYWAQEVPYMRKTYAGLGYAFDVEGNYAEARKNYNYSIQENAFDVTALINLANISRIQGDFKGAELNYKKVLKTDLFNDEVYHNLGDLYYRLGRFDDSKKYFLMAIRLNPYEKLTLVAMLRLFIHTKDVPNIKKYSSSYIEMEDDSLTLTDFGSMLAKEGFLDSAFDSYDKAIKRDQSNKRTYKELGKLMANVGNFEQAIKIWKVGLQIDPSDKDFKDFILKAQGLKGIDLDKAGRK
ncbi:MAG: tetratricopeptide repeat protein [Candidatus Omnitrophica bacterium]|nr:tetratricopeptide repeat protein [Candidatus Omnitrophota bacterium]